MEIVWRRSRHPFRPTIFNCGSYRGRGPVLGQEAVEGAGPVLHQPEPGPDQRGQLMNVVLGEVGQRSFEVRPDWLAPSEYLIPPA
jgi:hypothetical protein